MEPDQCSYAAFLQTVIPVATLIGNPESQGLKIWIPDKGTWDNKLVGCILASISKKENRVPIMDDDIFKKELLSRLDKILELLSMYCLPEATLDESPTESTVGTGLVNGETDATQESRKYLTKDEMQDDYSQAVRRWQATRKL
jgi:hypothetical protein